MQVVVQLADLELHVEQMVSIAGCYRSLSVWTISPLGLAPFFIVPFALWMPFYWGPYGAYYYHLNHTVPPFLITLITTRPTQSSAYVKIINLVAATMLATTILYLQALHTPL